MKEPKCQTCNDTKKVNYRGRTFTCGACAEDALSKAIQTVLKETAPAEKDIQAHEVCAECGGIDGDHEDDCEELVDTAIIIEGEPSA